MKITYDYANEHKPIVEGLKYLLWELKRENFDVFYLYEAIDDLEYKHKLIKQLLKQQKEAA